jgi:hypothetical protein
MEIKDVYFKSIEPPEWCALKYMAELGFCFGKVYGLSSL